MKNIDIYANKLEQVLPEELLDFLHERYDDVRISEEVISIRWRIEYIVFKISRRKNVEVRLIA